MYLDIQPYEDISKNNLSFFQGCVDKEITAHDAAVIMMALLKVARTKFGQPTEDTYVDAAYMAIAGECKHENDF